MSVMIGVGEAKMGGMNEGYDEGARRPRERSQQKQSDVRDCSFVLIGWVMRTVGVFCCCQCIPSKKLTCVALCLQQASTWLQIHRNVLSSKSADFLIYFVG